MLIEDDPRFLLDLLSRSLKLEVPPFTEISVASENHNEVLVVGGQSDRVVILHRAAPTQDDPSAKVPVLAIVTESQLGIDTDKWFSWPLYHASLRRKLGCEVWLVVVCHEKKVALWAGRPVPSYQPGSRFVPLVLGPSEIPKLKSLEEVGRVPALAVLSALAHYEEPDGMEVVVTGLKGADLIAERGGRRYHEIILNLLNEAGIELLEQMMMRNEDAYVEEIGRSYLGQKLKNRSEAKGEARGEAKGKAESVLRLLQRRGLEVDEAAQARILSCQDIQTLDLWFDRAISITTLDELFAPQ